MTRSAVEATPQVMSNPGVTRSPGRNKPSSPKTPSSKSKSSLALSPPLLLTAQTSASPSPSVSLPSLQTVLGDILKASPGLPTIEVYTKIEEEYVSAPSWTNRDKALIDSKTYLDILAVLRDSKRTDIGSAQFRFWARKTFRLGTADEYARFPHGLLHEGKRVAAKEDLYTIICKAHVECGHGGRDTTVKKVWETWRFVPKDLIARFVRACPTCAEKKAQKGIVSPTKGTKAKYESDEDDYDSELDDGYDVQQRTTPRASRNSQAIASTHKGEELNGRLFPFIPRLLISPVSEYPHGPFLLGESARSLKKSNSSSSSRSSTPFSSSSISSASSSATSSGSDLDLDVPLGSPVMELLTNFKPAPLVRPLPGRTHMLRPGTFATGRRSSAENLRQMASVSPNYHRPIVRARSMGTVKTIVTGDIPLNPALVNYPAPPSPKHPQAVDVKPEPHSSGAESNGPPPVVRRPKPTTIQTANTRFLTHSKQSSKLEASISSCQMPSAGIVSVDTSGAAQRNLEKHTQSSFSETSTSTSSKGKNTDSDPLPPTPSSAASTWSQDSAPNSAIFWDANARACSDSAEMLTPSSQSQSTRRLTSPSTDLRLLTLQDRSEEHETVTVDSRILHSDKRGERGDSVKNEGDNRKVDVGDIDDVESELEEGEIREDRKSFLSL